MLKAQGKSDGQTGTKILLEAMSKDKVHLARFVLDALDGEIVDSRTEGAQTPLISSILLPDSNASCKFAELLLQKGANVNCRDGTGRTALSYACERGHLDAVKILVRNNADPEIVDAWENTVLMYAAVAGHSPVVEFLVRAFKRLGLQIDRQNKVGNSAVEVAKFLGHAECVSALTHSSRKGDEGLGCADGGEHLQPCPRAECPLVQKCTWQPRPWVKQSGAQWMNSIDEFEREDGGSSSPPSALVFSEILPPRAPPRISEHSQNHKHPNTGDDHLPPLTQSCEAQKAGSTTTPTPNPNPSARSALDILLAPLIPNKREAEPGRETSKMLDYGVSRLHQKRCSLPTSMLSPAPRERALVPVRKTRTIRRREAEPPPLATSTSTFSVLSDKLFRRLTSAEFKTGVKELEESPALPSGRIPTFPRGIQHPQVGSKPSIDSISSVKCEFGILK